MRSQTDCLDDSSLGGLGQVSEAATALAGTRVPEQLVNIPPASEISTEPIATAKSIVLSVRPEDSFNPAVRLTKSHVRSSSKLAIVTPMIILAVTLATLILTGELSPVDIPPWMTNDGIVKFLSLRTAPDPVAAIAAGPTSPSLIIQPSRGTSNEPAPLGLAVHGPAEDAVVYIEGLVPGMELSTGRAVGDDTWEIPATELDYTWIAPPRGFLGSANLIAELRLPNNKIADRQAIHVAWESPISPAPVVPQLEERPTLESFSPDVVQIQTHRDEGLASQALVTAQGPFDGIAVVPSSPLEPVQLKPGREQIVPADSSAPALQRQLDGEEIIVLLKRGKDLFASGDLAAARLVLRKAADANNAEAALALGATYDPLVLRELKVYGFTPDAAMARTWYEKATDLGSPAAPRRLEVLTQGTERR